MEWEGTMKRTMLAAALLAVFGAVSQPTGAQDFPTRPMRMVIPFSAGAGTDLLGRLLANELTARLGSQVYVENKPGGGSQIGTDLVAKSPPDGSTMLWTPSDGLSVLPAVKTSLPYKIPDDFIFVASLTR